MELFDRYLVRATDSRGYETTKAFLNKDDAYAAYKKIRGSECKAIVLVKADGKRKLLEFWSIVKPLEGLRHGYIDDGLDRRAIFLVG